MELPLPVKLELRRGEQVKPLIKRLCDDYVPHLLIWGSCGTPAFEKAFGLAGCMFDYAMR